MKTTEAQRVASKKWRDKNKEKCKKWNREHIGYKDKYVKIWKKKHPEAVKRWNLLTRLKNYGITQEQLDAMYIKQNNKCAICGETFTKTAHIDHDHKTGKFRGLLCSRHNTMLGHAEDNITILNNAIKYLELNNV